MNALNFTPTSDDNIKYCILCKKKTACVHTVLKVGENITEYRWKKGVYYCDDCNRLLGKRYRENIKGPYAEYERVKKEEQLEEFEHQWSDITFAKTKELSDKVVFNWDKYQRRSPESGLEYDIICSVIFKDYWNVTADKVIEDLLDGRNDTPIVRMRHKEVLMLYIPGVIDAFRKGYRIQAKNKWSGLVDAINNKYSGQEKIVAKPEYFDKKTKKNEKRWYLLSYEDELNERYEINENKKRRIDYIERQEHKIVTQYAREHEEEIRERNSINRNDNESDKESSEGGDQ